MTPWQETAALRNFDPADVRVGSILSKKSVFSIGLPLMRHIRLELGDPFL